MAQQESHGVAGSVGPSIWDELQHDRIMEPMEAEPIVRGFSKRLFGTFYDHMGALLLLNLAVSLQLALGAALGVALAISLRAGGIAALIILGIVAALAAAPAVAGLFSYVRMICDDDAMPALADYVRGMRRYAVRSWILLLAQAGSGALLFINLRFYSTLHNAVGLGLVFLILLLCLLWAMAGLYAWPLLVRDLSWILILRNAFFLAMAAPFSTVAILLGLTAVSAVLLAVRVGWVLLLFVAWAMTENVTLQRLVRIFRERQQAAAVSEPAATNA